MCRFLLARLTFDSLVGQVARKAIKRALDNLSRGSGSLDSAYDEIMNRIEGQHPARRDLAKRALLWIAHGQRLLSVAEMQQAVVIEFGESDLDSDSMVECDEIISACAGLVVRGSDVEVLKSSRHPGRRITRRRDLLRLVHYTTKEYLERAETKYFPRAQEYLASSCLTYLLFDVFSGALCTQPRAFGHRVGHKGKKSLCFGSKNCWVTEQHEHKSPKRPGSFRQIEAYDASLCWNARDKDYPFYAYAAWYWGQHTENCDDEAIRILTERFLNDHKRVSGALYFVREDDGDSHWHVAFKLEDSNPGSAMQLAAFLGLTKIMSERLENGSEPDVKDWSGATPLFEAADRGHEDVVRLLMTRENVNPNVRGRYGRTPLMVVVLDGYIAIVQLLLAYEIVDLNAKDEVSGRSALHHAVPSQLIWRSSWQSQHLQIMKLLLACDNINVNLKDNEDQTPLMMAVESENEEAVRLLLAHRDIQVNERNNAGWTALHLAVRRSNAEAVQLLLIHGDIQANVRDDDGWTALHSAAGQGWIEGMRLLLAREDIQVNIRDNKGSTALHMAIVKLEIEALFGVKRNASDIPNVHVAELFLARGDVDVNIRDMGGYSALCCAIHSGLADVVQLLLMREDLEVNVEDGEGERLVSLAENVRDRECEGKRIDAYNATVISLRSYVQQRSSNTTSANLRQRIPERLAHTSNDNNDHEEEDEDGGDAAHRTNKVEVSRNRCWIWLLENLHNVTNYTAYFP